MSDNDEAVVVLPCPKCDEEVPDLDGFGVVRHEACGYCAHPAVSGIGGKCDICGRKVAPPKGTQTKRARHFRVPNVDMGDGKRVTVWFVVNPNGVVVRKLGSPRRFFVPLDAAARAIAIRGQVRESNRALGGEP